MFQRLPLILQWQVRREIDVVMSDPQMMRIVESSAKISDATDKFATAVAKYPDQFSLETQTLVKQVHEALSASIDQADRDIAAQRKAAIDQADKSIAAQREAMFKSLEDQTSRLGQLLDRVNGTVQGLDKAGASINDSTRGTVAATERASRSVLDHAFYLALALIVSIPLAMLTYRLAARRLGVAERG